MHLATILDHGAMNLESTHSTNYNFKFYYLKNLISELNVVLDLYKYNTIVNIDYMTNQ